MNSKQTLLAGHGPHPGVYQHPQAPFRFSGLHPTTSSFLVSSLFAEPALERLPEKGRRDVDFEPYHPEHTFPLLAESGAEDGIRA